MSEPRFPFPHLRPGQERLVDEIDGALRAGLVLLCSAPTGLGKTAAALYPACRHAIALNRRAFFVTAKVSQQTLALDTLREILREVPDACAVQIRAKGRSCPLDGLACREDSCRYLESFRGRLEQSGLCEELAEARVVDGRTIEERALGLGLCPFETSLALAERARVIVCDYNYVFDPRVWLRRFFEAPHDRDFLIVDEAHNLPARIRAAFSPELELGALAGAAAAARRLGSPAAERAALVLERTLDHASDAWRLLCEERGEALAHVEAPDAVFFEEIGIEAESALTGLSRTGLSGGGERAVPRVAPERLLDAGPRPRDPLRAALQALRDFASCASIDPERSVTIWQPERVRTLCLDPGTIAGARLRSFHAAICMSATLTPFEFVRRELGADDAGTETLELASPFPPENRLILAVPSVDTTYRERSAHAGAIARLLVESIAERRGNYLAFFPSFAYRDEVVALLPHGDYRLLLHTPGAPADSLLLALRRGSERTRLVCAVHGGVLAEGVDYPDEMAIGVFVVGPGLPKPSPELRLIEAYYERELGRGFEFAYLYPGLVRAVQAGGRAIRSADDRAFVMLLGRRFTEPRYRERLPRFWQEELVVAPDPLPVLRAFWKRHGKTDLA
jgi:DNA excision repair protein ERCC-2